MNIYEATVLSKNTNKCIKRQCPQFKHIAIKPSGLSDCCVVVSKTKRIPRWQPTEDDLIATDWVIVDEP